MTHTEAEPPRGLRERKREATRLRIASAAAALATGRGVAGVTAEQIAEAADVSRATFFRYFEAKETAIAEGFSGPQIEGLLAVLSAQPLDLEPLEALAETFRQLGQAMDETTTALVLEQARIIAASPALQAWIASAYLRDEVLVADVVARRLTTADPHDPRPRMVAAVAMAAIRVGLETWVALDGQVDLAKLFEDAVAAARTTGAER